MSVFVTLINAVTGPEVIFAYRTTLLFLCESVTVQLLTRETSDFITPTFWPANSPDLSPVDYQICGKLQSCVLQLDS